MRFGSTCNHIAAVLFKLDYAWQNGLTNRACTSLPVKWTAPSTSKKGVQLKPINDLKWRKPHYTKKGPHEVVINPAARRLFSPVRETRSVSVPSLESLMGALYASNSKACAFQYAIPDATPNYAPEDNVNVEGEMEIETSCSIPLSLKEMTKKASNPEDILQTKFTVDEVLALEEATRQQADNQVWAEQRIGRVTGSVAHVCLTKARKMKNQSSLTNNEQFLKRMLGDSSPDPNLVTLKYGREMEPVARQKYKQLMMKQHAELDVSECGLFVDPNNIFMAASPDAVVSCKCCGKGLLEIKCPFKVAHLDPKVSPPSYLVKQSKQLTLKESHPYYTQIAMQLTVTGLDWCDFFVYTHQGHHLERLYKSAMSTLIEELQDAARTIFEHLLLPRLMETSASSATVTEEENDGEPPKKRIKAFVCLVCSEECKESGEIERDDDNSIGCDKCFNWYHWSCVGYDGQEIHEWFCSNCSA